MEEVSNLKNHAAENVFQSGARQGELRNVKNDL